MSWSRALVVFRNAWINPFIDSWVQSHALVVYRNAWMSLELCCTGLWKGMGKTVSFNDTQVWSNVKVYGNAWIKPVNDESLLSLQRLWSADTLLRLCPAQFMNRKNSCQQCPSWCRSHSGGDCVVFGTVSLFPHLLGSRSLPLPLWGQLSVKQV